MTKLEQAIVALQHGVDLLVGQGERQQNTIDLILAETRKTNNRVTKLEDRPFFASPIGVEEAKELLKQHRDLWSTWRFSRWFIPLSIPVVLAAATVGTQIVLWYVTKGG